VSFVPCKYADSNDGSVHLSPVPQHQYLLFVYI